jgi:hypothetical protein
MESFLSLLFDPRTTSESDKLRWFAQPIQTKYNSVGGRPNVSEEKHYFWGLMQTHGGPCGVIACIQAEMIRSLKLYDDINKVVSPQEAEKALCDALGTILARCAVAPPVDSDRKQVSADLSCIKLVLSDAAFDLSIDNFQSFGDRLKMITIESTLTSKPCEKQVEIQCLSEDISNFLFQSGYVKNFSFPCGVILFLLSIVLSRGMDTIQSGK